MPSIDIYTEILSQYVIDQTIFEQYISICNRYKTFKNKKDAVNKLRVSVECHHILPKCFKLGGEKDKQNIAYLPLEEHRYVHKLLTNIFDGKMKQQMAYAYLRIIRRQNSKEKLSIEEYVNLRREVGKLVAENNKNRIITETYRSNMSKAKKDTIWINNGNIEIMIKDTFDLPHGFSEGRLLDKTNNGKIYITDGIKNRMIDDTSNIPPNWYIGFSRKKTNSMILKICPHCNKEGSGANMTRYHFNNCKRK